MSETQYYKVGTNNAIAAVAGVVLIALPFVSYMMGWIGGKA
jgi:hypothetical protein